MITFEFNPARVAYFEATGWRAYYDRDWLKLFRLIASLSQEQFHIPFPLSWLAAYYTAQASRAWVPVDHDLQAIIANFEKFYRMAKRYSGLQFDPKRAAILEERYWTAHRKLVGNPDKTEFIQAMTELHSEIFGLPLERARESAELRVLANNTVDLITSQTSTDPEADWKKLEDYLRQCYESIRRELRVGTGIRVTA